jgi:DNA-binding NtrC family response regulator
MASAWPPLAEAAGVPLRLVQDVADAAAAPSIAVLLAGAGTEALLVDASRQLGSSRSPVAAIGSTPDHRLAAAVVRAGAQEYFALPNDLPALEAWVRERATSATQRASGELYLSAEADANTFDGILGDSAALRAALDRATRVMKHGAVTVLLTGETGTGKELLARAIHAGGPRRSAPFVDVNCAAIPDALLESELFGHEKGAFTSATAAKPGLFEVADGGTVFLDEIGHLPLALQGKLLRALQEREIRRVGATRSIAIDVRVIAATHVNLALAAKRGEFREDLYYRLNVVPIELPPLRARGRDPLLLARAFLARFAEEYGIPGARLSPSAEQALLEHPWPGNIRELRNTIERAVLLADRPVLDADALFADGVPQQSAPAGDGTLPFPASMDDIEAAAVRAMLALCGGNKSEAARRLRISRMRLLRLLGDSAAPSDAPTESFDA